MDRRNFLIGSSLTSAGLILTNYISANANGFLREPASKKDSLYHIFKDPDPKYRPYVRWWWNGDKVKKEELARELRVLKDAGISGVEINPIAFPARTDDMGIQSIEWLSDEWIEMLQFAFKEARSLHMTCDLIVGTGFPFGGEFLQEADRSQIVVIGVKKLVGPTKIEFSLFDLFKEADPQIGNVCTSRTMEMLAVKLVPDPLTAMDDVMDLSDQIKNGHIKVSAPAGRFALYVLVKATGFERVIVGAPGGKGPVLNHFDKRSVTKYLNNVSGKIEKKLGPLPSNFRSFFVDSMELEGANWSAGMLDEFKKRRGYDIFPYLPFILFKIGHMGNTINLNYTAEYGPDLNKMFERMRYDWALTNAEVFRENFVESFAGWCTQNKVKSRAQAYGRGYFLLEGSFPIDIPECETWLKYGIGKDISEEAFTRYPWHLGQGNTMINKYVSSAAHLKNKRLISSEELTNTAMVFNESFEIFKIAGDQSTISGVTQPVFHGFNYSPPDAPFPGWIRWGGYFNEKNTMWPYLKLYTDYRSRISALLQQGAMYADMALLAPIPDMWGKFGAQNEPFPSVVWPDYQMLVWESIHQNGNACDYVSEQVINEGMVQNGSLHFGNRKYHTLFLIDVHGIDPSTIRKLYDFIAGGGKIFCIEAYPDHYPGWDKHLERDKEVRDWVNKMKQFPNRFVLIQKPEENFCEWMKDIQHKYGLTPYVKISEPQKYITQVRYQMDDADVFFFTNSSDSHDYMLNATFSNSITKGRRPWLWDAATGKRFKMKIDNNRLRFALGPADSAIIVFNEDEVDDPDYLIPTPLKGDSYSIAPGDPWEVQLQRYDGHMETAKMKSLSDLKTIPEYAHFAGTLKYKNTFSVKDPENVRFLNLGKVYGISIVFINGKKAGVKWFGHRIYSINEFLKEGDNTVEIWIVTVMVNYMKTLKNNAIAQFWTNEGRKDQPLQSLGLAGPVRMY